MLSFLRSGKSLFIQTKANKLPAHFTTPERLSFLSNEPQHSILTLKTEFSHSKLTLPQDSQGVLNAKAPSRKGIYSAFYYCLIAIPTTTSQKTHPSTDMINIGGLKSAVVGATPPPEGSSQLHGAADWVG